MKADNLSQIMKQVWNIFIKNNKIQDKNELQQIRMIHRNRILEYVKKLDTIIEAELN